MVTDQNKFIKKLQMYYTYDIAQQAEKIKELQKKIAGVKSSNSER